MWARRLQLYWFPMASTAAVALAALFLDLPERSALVYLGAGVQMFDFDTSWFVGVSLGILVAVWVAQAVTDRPRRSSPFGHHAYYVAGGILFANLQFLAGGHGRTSTTSGAPAWTVIGLPAAAFLANHLAAKLEDARSRLEGGFDSGAERGPSLDLGRTETALWTGRKTAWGYPILQWAMTPVLGATVFLVLSGPGGFHPLDVPLLAFYLALFAYGVLTSVAEVTVTETAVRVSAGPFGLPLWTIPTTDVVEAAVEEVRPVRRYGGYGYRARGGRRCLIVRAGKGLLLRRRVGRDVVVSVDGAEEAAALVNALVERGAAARSDL